MSWSKGSSGLGSDSSSCSDCNTVLMFDAGRHEPLGALCACEMKIAREKKWRQHVEHVEANATLAVNVGMVAVTSRRECYFGSKAEQTVKIQARATGSSKKNN